MFLTQNDQGVAIKINVQPRASKNEIKGMHGDSLKVRLTSPPVDGEANKACIQFFSKLCRVPKRDVSILQGQKGRNKTVLVKNLPKTAIIQILTEYI